MAQIIGTQVTWGADDSGVGIVQSGTVTNGAQTKEFRAIDGEVAALVVYDKHTEITIDAILTADTTPPEIGSTFTVGSKTFYCTSSQIAWSNEDAKKITISGRTYNFGAKS